jgi:hypothetical protein
MAQSRALASVCASSNLFLGSGLFDFDAALDAGMALSLGTDVGGGQSFSMFAAMRSTHEVARLRGQAVSALQLWYWPRRARRARWGGRRELVRSRSMPRQTSSSSILPPRHCWPGARRRCAMRNASRNCCSLCWSWVMTARCARLCRRPSCQVHPSCCTKVDMILTHLLSQAARMTWRDWRAGELRLLAAALVVAVAAVTSVGFLVDRIRLGLERDATQLLGADLVIGSDTRIDPALREAGAASGARHGIDHRFSEHGLRRCGCRPQRSGGRESGLTRGIHCGVAANRAWSWRR